MVVFLLELYNSVLILFIWLQNCKFSHATNSNTSSPSFLPTNLALRMPLFTTYKFFPH
ncbi:unnamed protein product, partial [Prunus brigantina]